MSKLLSLPNGLRTSFGPVILRYVGMDITYFEINMENTLNLCYRVIKKILDREILEMSKFEIDRFDCIHTLISVLSINAVPPQVQRKNPDLPSIHRLQPL